MIDPGNVILFCILLASIALYVQGVYHFYRFFKDINRNQLFRALAYEIVSCVALYIPFEYLSKAGIMPWWANIIESIPVAVLKIITKAMGEGYERIELDGHPFLSSVYSWFSAVVIITTIIIVTSSILSFVFGIAQKIKLKLRKGRYTYVFSEINNKTLAIAKSIGEKDNCNIVFLDSGSELSFEQKTRLSEIKGIPLDDEIDNVIRSSQSNPSGLEVFLFNGSEEKNIIQLEKVYNAISDSSFKIKVFVELSDTPWDMYDNLHKRLKKKLDLPDEEKLADISFNFVRTEENFVYNDLLDNSIFEHCIENKITGEREIKILIAGVNNRNLEMIKAVLHLSQIPSYKLTLLIIDSEDQRDYLYARMPEIYDECTVVGDAYYSLIYCGGIEFKGIGYEEAVIKNMPDYTFAFINAGDDFENINLAIRTRILKERDLQDNYAVQVNLERAEQKDYWSSSMRDGLTAVGAVEDVYSYSFITMSRLEEVSKKVHEFRQEQKLQDAVKAGEQYTKTDWNDYYNNEYNRHSVYARTLAFKYKIELIETTDILKGLCGRTFDRNADDRWVMLNDITKGNKAEYAVWKLYEHMRWNVYTRTLGYVNASPKMKAKQDECIKKIQENKQKIKDGIGDKNELENQNEKLDREVKKLRLRSRSHSDLILFEDLPDDVKKNDSLSLNEEIVKAFEELIPTA